MLLKIPVYLRSLHTSFYIIPSSLFLQLALHLFTIYYLVLIHNISRMNFAYPLFSLIFCFAFSMSFCFNIITYVFKEAPSIPPVPRNARGAKYKTGVRKNIYEGISCTLAVSSTYCLYLILFLSKQFRILLYSLTEYPLYKITFLNCFKNWKHFFIISSIYIDYLEPFGGAEAKHTFAAASKYHFPPIPRFKYALQLAPAKPAFAFGTYFVL